MASRNLPSRRVTQARKLGLDRIPSREKNKVTVLQNLFRSQMIELLKARNPDYAEPALTDPDPGLLTSGYFIGKEQFIELLTTFIDYDGIRISFGMNTDLANKGRLQLIFTGVGLTESGDSVLLTDQHPTAFVTHGPGTINTPDTSKGQPCPPFGTPKQEGT